jgi:cellulose synthase operon protein C
MMMKACVIRLWAPAILLGAIAVGGSQARLDAQAPSAPTQASPSPTQSLLDKAREFEARGRIDLAVQTWQQVLLTDPKNAVALGELARAAALDGNAAMSRSYLERLRAINPNDPNIARVEKMSMQRATETPTPANPGSANGETTGSAVNTELSTARARSLAEMAAYQSLNAKRIDEAETRFKAILAKEPGDSNALAGMGYVRMQQGNFMGAVSFLEQAKQDRPNDIALAAALDTARFWFIVSEGQNALNANDLTTAEKRFRAALELRADSPNALEGLGNTLLNAQQPRPAITLFQRVVELDPASAHGWRGLFIAQYRAGNVPLALTTDRRIPAGVHAQLMSDPLFLQTLASAYSATGRGGDAQRVLESAVKLPFPADAKALKAEIEVQLAGVLFTSNQLGEAAGLYAQLLAEDSGNISARQGLVQVQHAMGHDEEALQTIEKMPPASYAEAMRDPGFVVTVATIYQAEKKLDVAQDLLQKAAMQQTNAGQKPSVAIQLQLAGIYIDRGSPQLAYPIYKQVLSENPDRADAWAGLLSTLHLTGHDTEAISQVELIPAGVRKQLETNAGYLQTMASVYGTQGRSREATLFLGRVEQGYAAQRTAPPADVEIQNAWLLYNGVDDPGLYRQLMSLGGRSDLTEQQSRTVQTIWTNWAMRRANQAAAAGNSPRALAILNAAAQSFSGDPAVVKALANEYAQTGQPEQAVQIYRQQNMASASAADYETAVGAALATDDSKDAEIWLRYALTKYPSDPKVLILGARFEQARGDTSRAIEYYRASLKAMPPPRAGALPAVPTPTTLPNAMQAQNLSILLAPETNDLTRAGVMQSEPAPPSYTGSAQLPPYDGAVTGIVPPYMTNPAAQPDSKVRDSVPPSAAASGAGDTPGHAEVELAVRNATAGALSQTQPVSQQEVQSANQSPATPAGGSTPQADQQVARLTEPSATQAPPVSGSTGSNDETYRPFVPYVAPPRSVPPVSSADPRLSNPSAVAVQLGNNTPPPVQPQSEMTDVFPTARYVPNTGANRPASDPNAAAEQAARIRRLQAESAAPRTGQSHPPPEEPITGKAQVAQPSTVPTSQVSSVPDTGSQQYPQPRTQPAPIAPSTRSQARLAPAPTPAATASTAKTAAEPASPEPAPPVSADSGVDSSGLGQPLNASPYPVAPPPTDAELAARNLPPLHGYYSGQTPIPLTPRQSAESALASLEGSYSGWLGATGIGRYRSGTSGLDRLFDVEAPVEASAAIGRLVRLTAVALPVFLNSGVLNTSGLTTTYVTYLGTLPANSLNPPAQQFSNGIGGELQLTTRNIGLAAGYSPSGFLVRNITGRFAWRPLGGHLSLFADRDSVKDTQLSYAGLRDPGVSSLGPIWGGVISTTGGVRLDIGSGGASFYASGEGGVLTGRHVLNNTKFGGATGANFRVKTWPGYGNLTLGGALSGMHYANNELGLSYGQGGYFSPKFDFVASVPVTFNGAYKSNFHYVVAGALGVQTFEQDKAPFYPLDPSLQATFVPCTTGQVASYYCGVYPLTVTTSFDYAIHAQVSYRFAEHWYGGGFLSGNNTNNYNTVSAGFFFRYVFRAQHSWEGHPTGLFPVEGFRPLQIP